jgi:hypothetical protein
MRFGEFANNILSDAISSPLGRDEEIQHKISRFLNAPTVHSINGLELKKYFSADQDELWYGLANYRADPPVLVGVLQLEKITPGWQVRLSQVQEGYKSQGYGTFLYDHAVMNDGLTIFSDVSQTEGAAGGSRGLWEKLYRQGRFRVSGYRLDTGEIIDLEDSSEISAKIYNQKENMVWMASPKTPSETIQEMISRLTQQNKYRTVQWYGPDIRDSC